MRGVSCNKSCVFGAFVAYASIILLIGIDQRLLKCLWGNGFYDDRVGNEMKRAFDNFTHRGEGAPPFKGTYPLVEPVAESLASVGLPETDDEGGRVRFEHFPPCQCRDTGCNAKARGLDCQKRLPSVIGIGIEKCGTGALTFFLRTHPSIMHSHPKELYYWSKHRNQSMEWYRSLMPVSSQHQVTMEYTPSYLYGRDIPQRMRARLPDARFLVMMRDPIARAMSHYLHIKHQKWSGLDDYVAKEPGRPAHRFRSNSFDRTVMDGRGNILDGNAVIENGLYEVHLRRWFRVFPAEQFLIIDEGAFKRDPISVLNEVEDFIGVPRYFDEEKIYFDEDRGFFCLNAPFRLCQSESKGRPHTTIPDSLMKKLGEFYRPYDIRLENLLNRNFTWMKDFA